MVLPLGELDPLYKKDREWADSYIWQVRQILKNNSAHLLSIEISDDYSDTKEATDMVAEVEGGTIAVRLRRDGYKYRDLTIRSRRASGIETELAKIMNGWAQFYLYGWMKNGKIEEWMLIDLNKIRELGLLESRKEIPNKDKVTWFIAIPAKELDEAGCLLNRKIAAL